MFPSVEASRKSTGSISSGSYSPAILSLRVAGELGIDAQTAVTLGQISVLLHTAADLADDIEDGDLNHSLWTRYGHAQADNVANGLLFLCHRTIDRLLCSEVQGCHCGGT